MNAPRFTAEASLYRTRRHYKTGRQAIHVPTQMINTIGPALIRQDGIDCANCVGGECAQLHCFENWTHGGGGPGGPYEGPSGGVGSGGLRGAGQTCWWKPFCATGCDRDRSACRDNCIDEVRSVLEGDILDSIKDPYGFIRNGISGCDSRCAESQARCLDDCKTCA